MHQILPFENWLDYYDSEEDDRSVFFHYSEKLKAEILDEDSEPLYVIYNYIIHPNWDFFGSKTLYLKVLYANYQLGYVALEFLGEWNDAIENDIMILKRNVLEPMMDQGLNKFLFITENVLNIHYTDDDYYEEFVEEVNDKNGWIKILNFPEHLIQEIEGSVMYQEFEFIEIHNWRNYKPLNLFRDLDIERKLLK